MNELLCRQLALDYCCRPEEVRDHHNYFTEHEFLEGRRRFQESADCFLKLAVVNGKLLFTGRRDIVSWCRENYQTCGSAWFLEAKNIHRLDDRLREDGYQIETMHPFFIAESVTEVDTKGYEIRWYQEGEIEQFRGDEKYGEAFAFCKDAPDMAGVAAVRGGKILGMAGASCDSSVMWQIGINVAPEAEGCGIGKMLVCLLKNELLKKGILPFYGTSLSHIASQRVAVGAGFVPMWVELLTSKCEENF